MLQISAPLWQSLRGLQITTGLLTKASDEHLRGVLAHEIAHDDLGHVARAQTLGAGLNIGVILLEQLFPGSSAVTPTSSARRQPPERIYGTAQHLLRCDVSGILATWKFHADLLRFTITLPVVLPTTGFPCQSAYYYRDISGCSFVLMACKG